MVIGALVTSIFSFLALRSREQQIPRSIAIGALIGGILVLLAGLISGFEESETAKLLQNKTAEIAVLSQRNAELSSQIADLAKQNAELNEYTANAVTGGDSYCYLLTHFDFYGIVNWSLQHEGDYPLYDINVRIIDLTKRSKLFKKSPFNRPNLFKEEWNKLQKGHDFIGEMLMAQRQSIIYTNQLPTLSPGAIVMPLVRFELPKNQDEQQYLVKIYARNGTITQPIKFRKVGGNWEMSMRVQKFDSKTRKIVELQKVLHPEVPLADVYAGE